MEKSVVEEALQIASKTLTEIRKRIVTQVDHSSISEAAKISFKAKAMRELLICRVSELGFDAYDCYRDEKYLSAAIFTRSLLETVAFIHWLAKRIKAAVETSSVGDIDDFLMKCLFGGRDSNRIVESYNVLTAIGHVQKDHELYDKWYELLSEYCHPSCLSVLVRYSTLDKERGVFDLHSEDERFPIGAIVSTFVGSLLIGNVAYSDIKEKFERFTEICEDALTGRKQQGPFPVKQKT